MTLTIPFTVIAWDPLAADVPDAHARIRIRKTFTGALEAESVGEGLFVGLDDPALGAGYVVSERIVGRLEGREGTFVVQHGGIAAPGAAPHSFGHVVPGAGTGALADLRGTAVFGRDDDGAHWLTLTLAT
jgi:hypothetical protein